MFVEGRNLALLHAVDLWTVEIDTRLKGAAALC